jgi:hypothetical protein
MLAAKATRHAFPLVAFAAAMATFYPGHLSFDSAVQYWSARTGEYYNVSPPLQPVLWSVIQSAWPGSGGLFALQTALFVGGIWAACSALFTVAWKRIAASLYVILGTPALLVVTHLWTDALMIASLVAGCGMVLAADCLRSRPLLFASLPLLAMGGMARHNALPALVPLLVWWGVVCARIARPRRSSRVSHLLIGALAGAVAIAGASWLLDHVVVKHRVFTFTAVQVFDIAGISARAGELLFPAFMIPDGFTMEELRARYVPYNNVPLFQGGIRETLWEGALTDEELAELRKAWRSAIISHPEAYFSHRFAVSRWLFDRFRNDRPQQLAFVEAIGTFGGNPIILPNSTALHRWAMAWYARSIGWWGFAPITYILVAVGVVMINWRARATPLGQAALALAASGLAYVAPLPLVVPSAELRYSGWMFAATSLAVIVTIKLLTLSRASRFDRGDVQFRSAMDATAEAAALADGASRRE